VDYADLDGNLLIANDPFAGVLVEKGKLILPDRPGLGLRPAEPSHILRRLNTARETGPRGARLTYLLETLHAAAVAQPLSLSPYQAKPSPCRRG